MEYRSAAMYSPAAPPPRREVPSGGTARILLLIAVILEGIGGVGLLILLGLFATVLSFGSLGLIAVVPLALFGGLGAIEILLLVCTYLFCYKRTAQFDYEGARTPTLVLAILGLFLGGIILGILMFVAYAKLGDAINEQRPTAAPAYYAPPYPVAPGYPGGGPGPAPWPVAGAAPPAVLCPQCHRPASFIVQYGRYYCYPCARYV